MHYQSNGMEDLPADIAVTGGDKFDLRWLTPLRIDKYLRSCGQYAIQNQGELWHYELLNLYKEARTKLGDAKESQPKIKHLNDMRETCHKEHQKLMGLRAKNRKYRDITITPEFHLSLQNFEIEMRIILKDIIMPKKDPRSEWFK